MKSISTILLFLALAATAHGSSFSWSNTGSGYWSTPTNWSGSSSYPGNTGGTADTFSLSAGTAILDGVYTLGMGTISGTGVISSTAANAGLTFTSTAAPCLTYTGSSVGIAVSSGSTALISSSGTLLNTALANSGTLIGILISGGTHTLNGAIVVSNNAGAAGIGHGALKITGGSATLRGDAIQNNNGTAVAVTGGSLSHIGTPFLRSSYYIYTNGYCPVKVTSGYYNWTGSSSISSSYGGFIAITGGTASFTGLSFSDSGTIFIHNAGGNITGTPSITLATSAAQFAVMGGTTPSGTGTLAGITPYIGQGNLSASGSNVLTGSYYTLAGGTVSGTYWPHWYGSAPPSAGDAVTMPSDTGGALPGALSITSSQLTASDTTHGFSGTYWPHWCAAAIASAAALAGGGAFFIRRNFLRKKA